MGPSVKSVLGRMVSTTILKYGPNILITHVTTKGEGVAGPLSSKRLLKKSFFFGPPPLGTTSTKKNYFKWALPVKLRPPPPPPRLNGQGGPFSGRQK